MIPNKTRRSIEAVFEQYGRDIPLVMDERLGDGAFFLVQDEDGPRLRGSTRIINWARDILNNSFVPECYADEASTCLDSWT